MDLFEQQNGGEETRGGGQPLAARMRPRNLNEVAGQHHILAPGQLLRRAIESDRLGSIILYGPPGCGKTSLAEVIALVTDRYFERTSGVLANVAILRSLLEAAEQRKKFRKRETILFIDEIHRFNKAQQDALLPHVENGTLVLVGATTENPSFEVIAALLSRTRVLRLEPLDQRALVELATRALNDSDRGLGRRNLDLDESAARALAAQSDGDARIALGILEIAADLAQAGERSTITLPDVIEAAGSGAIRYDRSGDEHYNVISAFIKSLRGSDIDASLYYLARIIEAGEDQIGRAHV